MINVWHFSTFEHRTKLRAPHTFRKTIKKWKCPRWVWVIVFDIDVVVTRVFHLTFYFYFNFFFISFSHLLLLLLIWLKWSKHRNLWKMVFRHFGARETDWVFMSTTDGACAARMRPTDKKKNTHTEHDKQQQTAHIKIKGANCQIQRKVMPDKNSPKINGTSTSIPLIFQRRRPVCCRTEYAAFASLFLVEFLNAPHSVATRTKSHVRILVIFSFRFILLFFSSQRTRVVSYCRFTPLLSFFSRMENMFSYERA